MQEKEAKRNTVDIIIGQLHIKLSEHFSENEKPMETLIENLVLQATN